MKNRPTRKSFQAKLDQMVRQLRNDIVTGRYAAGDFLPSETALVEQYELSNKSIRRGLDQLVEEGYIIKKHRIGAMVTETALQSKVTITLGVSPSIERDLDLQHVLDSFHRDNPGIRVKTITFSTSTSFDYLNTARQYLENGLIDVMSINHINFQEFAEHESTHLLEPLAPNAKHYPFLTEAFTLKKKTYVQPLVFTPVILCYNKDHFREADLLEPDSSWTWDDVARAAEKLAKPPERHGLYFHLLSENRWPVFLLQSGMTFRREEEGRYRLNGTKLIDSIELCGELIHNRKAFPNFMSENSDDAIQLFLQEKLSLTLINYLSLNEFKDSDLNYDICPLPYINKPATLLISIGMAINAKSDQKEAAGMLVDYLASEKAQRLLRERTLSIPSMKPIAEWKPENVDETLNRPESYYLFKDIMPTYHFHRDLNLTANQFKSLKSTLQLYWSGLLDKNELASKLEEELEASVLM